MATARVAKAKAAIRAGQDGLFAGTVCASLGRQAVCGVGDDRASKWAHTSSLWWSTGVYSLSHECEAVERTLVRAYEGVYVVVCVWGRSWRACMRLYACVGREYADV